MSKLRELINELCPDGVEYKTLKDVTIFNGLKQVSAEKLSSLNTFSGRIKLLPSSSNYDWYCEETEEISEYLQEDEVITLGRARNANVKYHCGKFIASQNHIIRSKNKKELNTKYLYYFLLSKAQNFYTTQSNYPLFNKNDFNICEIPVPPLPVQEEIVRILDKMTGYVNELKAELKARKMQYEYYRDELIDNVKGEKGKLIDMLIQPITDGPHTTPTLYKNGVPFISATAVYDGKVHLKDKKGYISKEFDEECAKKYKPMRSDVFMVKSGSTTGKVAFVDFDEDFNVWSPIAALRTNNKNSPRFLFHLLQTSYIQKQVKERMSHGSQPNLSMRVLENFDVCIPSLEKQIELANFLDRIENICNNLSSGLPAEIEARQKQYEHYRDKLLSFKEISHDSI